MGKLTKYGLIAIEALRQALAESMMYDWIVFEYSNIDDEYPNEYDNPIVQQIMAME